ncbi:kinetochore protein nuf2 [Diplodia corticola]|uniref:Probable kinetochore protein NUF2 n=1 Tax=Diplodia corticola TaxID=236234 RepID=A0A1J9RKP2_9PEZI|nr:kinetochore protein nuf2 [Diplodia corticola]OJD40538.1 kinetochore protein nuf2 [Diplodia corticola]
MAYNPRISMARDSNMNSNRSRQHKEDPFTLPDHEIANCITDIGINFSIADLQKPNPQHIQKLFEWFAELLMNTTREVVAPAMKAAADDMAGDDLADRIFTPDTRDLMGFFVIMRKLLMECGIDDFTFQDLYKPTRERLVKILSYTINFIRFRESQTTVIDQHLNKSERTKLRIDQLYNENQDKENHLRELERSRKTTEMQMAAKEKRQKELKQRLLDLKMGQEKVVERLEMLRDEQRRLRDVLENKTEQTMNVRQDAAKLRPYTTQSPAVLESSLKDLNANLAADKAAIDALDRRGRALQTSTDTFTAVTQDVDACTRLLGDLAQDIRQEQEELAKGDRHRQALSERSNSVRDVERQEKLLTKQLANVSARTEKLRKNADDKAEAARVRMEELKSVHKKLAEERGEKSRDMERRRVRIEQTEKKMADLKENIENEVNNTREQYMQLESHIKLYITEMDQSLGS